MTAERKLRQDEQTGLLLVDGPEDIPDFASEDEEVTFWATHAFSEQFWKGATRGAPAESLRAHVPPKRRQAGQQAG